jgi:hypothetical protein
MPVLGLQQSDKELRDFIEHAAVAMHWVAADGTILWANEAELKLLFVAPESDEVLIPFSICGACLLQGWPVRSGSPNESAVPVTS